MCRLTESDHSSRAHVGLPLSPGSGWETFTRGRLAEEYGRAVNVQAQRAVAIAACA